jgi:hypothetical protein
MIPTACERLSALVEDSDGASPQNWRRLFSQPEIDHFVMAITSAAAIIRHTASHLAQMAHGEFTISFSNQCERNYSLDRPRWEVLFMWNQRRPKSRWIKSQTAYPRE